MPKINDIKIKKSNKFVKVAYRPWENDRLDIRPEVDQANIIEKNFHTDTDLKEKNNDTKDIEKIFRSLFGLQKKIMTLLCNKAPNQDSVYIYTNAFTVIDIASYTQSTKASVSASLLRLKNKELILSHENKTGRGGYAIYKIRKDIGNFIKKNTLDDILKK